MQTQVKAKNCVHSNVANVLFKVEIKAGRCYLSVRTLYNFMLFKHKVIKNRTRLLSMAHRLIYGAYLKKNIN